MKQERILYAMGSINDKLIFDAMNDGKPAKKAWVRRLSVAACLALVLAVGVPYVADVVAHKGGHIDVDLDVITLIAFGGAYYEVIDTTDTKALDRFGLPHEITPDMIGASLGSGEDSNGDRIGAFYRYVPYDHILTVLPNGDTRPATAVYIYEDDGEYAFALFCNYLSFDGNTHQEASEMFAVYGIDEAEDIASIEIGGKKVTDREIIRAIYETVISSRSMGGDDFDKTIFKGKNEQERTALSWEIADSTVGMRIETVEGLVTGELRYHTSIGYVSWALNYYRLDAPLEY